MCVHYIFVGLDIIIHRTPVKTRPKEKNRTRKYHTCAFSVHTWIKMNGRCTKNEDAEMREECNKFYLIQYYCMVRFVYIHCWKKETHYIILIIFVWLYTCELVCISKFQSFQDIKIFFGLPASTLPYSFFTCCTVSVTFKHVCRCVWYGALQKKPVFTL